MGYKLIDEMLGYKHELYFLQLAKELKIENALIESGIPLPIDYYKLKEQVLLPEDQTFSILDFMEGMVKVLAIDKSFNYRNLYIRFLENCPAELLELVYQKAVDFKEKKDFLQALMIFKGLIQLFPSDEKVLYLYGCTALDYYVLSVEEDKKRHLEEVAKLIFEKMIRNDIGRPYAYYQLGFIYNNMKQYDKALESFQFALSLISDEMIRDDILENLPLVEDRRLFQLGIDAVDRMQWHEALDCLLPLTERYDDWWELFLALGICYRQLKQFENAHLYLRKARVYNQEDLGVLYELSQLHIQWGNWTEAKDILAKALGHAPENPLFIFAFSNVLHTIGEKDIAVRFLKQGLVLDPENREAAQLLEEWQNG